jgi:hypothetical protein
LPHPAFLRLLAPKYWKGKAGILSPPDASGISSRIVGITADRFNSESEAREYILRAAKKRIDDYEWASETAQKEWNNGDFVGENDSSKQVR